MPSNLNSWQKIECWQHQRFSEALTSSSMAFTTVSNSPDVLDHFARHLTPGDISTLVGVFGKLTDRTADDQ